MPPNECITATCVAGMCDTTNVASGTATTAQTAGDCLQNQCDGNGAITAVNDNTDVQNDSNPCTADACAAGVPTHLPVAMGTVCGMSQTCDAVGNCLGCTTAATCPGADDECKTRTCSAGTCGFSFTPAGTTTTAQTAGDCKQSQCDGAGNITAANDNADVPVDGVTCTSDVCTAGVPSNPPAAAGTACAQSGGTTCNAVGACVQCNTTNDCPGSDTDCHLRTCMVGMCGVFNVAAGNPTTAQTTGNCQINQCDGSGNAVNAADNTDKPIDSNQCTSDICTAGVPSNPPTAAGSVCAQNGGTSCDGAGTCGSSVTTDFDVLRLGDGTAALSSASTPGFLEHRLLDGTSAGATISLPTAPSGANKPITFSGSATSEGSLSRSADGHYLTLAGYAAAPGVASINMTTAAAYNRVIGRVDASGVVDTTTLFTTAFTGNNIRTATTNDGTSFWAAGGNSGVQYIQLGQTTSTQLTSTLVNIRTLAIFGGQLHGSSGSGTFTNVFTVGTGLPTTANQTTTSLPGMPTATASPYAFVLLDRNVAVAGLDTLYVADDRGAASGGGIQKWTFNGTTWTLVNTLVLGTTGFRGVAGVVTGNNVTLIATTTATSANTVVVFIDDGSASPVGTVIATAPTNTVYRGIAFAPK